MKQTNRTTPERRAALADIHRMRNIIGMDREEWVEFLRSAFHAESAKDLSDFDLGELRSRLHDITDPRQTATGRNEAERKAAELTKWRKKVYGVIADYLRHNGYNVSSEAIRTIACRATRRGRFGEIALSELRQLYWSWRRKDQVSKDTLDLLRVLDPANLN